MHLGAYIVDRAIHNIVEHGAVAVQQKFGVHRQLFVFEQGHRCAAHVWLFHHVRNKIIEAVKSKQEHGFLVQT